MMGGFECATGINRHGDAIDQIAATQHDLFVRDDYARLADAGILVAREGVRWPLVERGASFDFSSLDPMLCAAAEFGIQLVLDLFHYGFADGVDPFSDELPDRFARYGAAVCEHVARKLPGPLLFTPVNEPSYFAWAAGDEGLFWPHERGRGPELKRRMVHAAIACIDAIRAICPDARFLNADPLCRVVAPAHAPELADGAKWFNENAVFEAWDILAGRVHPELGGSRSHLDIVGLNYYWTNQWEHTIPDSPLCESDERCWPLRDLVRWVWHRYQAEIVITETSHYGDRRGPYLNSLVDEIEAILDEGIPLRGVCLYPILGMPEWHDSTAWARMGLWDLIPDKERLERVVHAPMLEALKEAQRRLEGLTLPSGAPAARFRLL